MAAAVSDLVLHILLALSDQARHGYAIAVEIEERTSGLVKIGTGTLYTALKRLRADGLIEELAEAEAPGDHRARRTYGLTESGRALLAEQTERLRVLIAHALAKDVLGAPEIR